MGRESLANRLSLKRKAGFLKTFNKRIDALKREKERLERALEDRDSLANQPWLDRIERTVQGFVGAGPVYGITPVSDWAKRSLEHIKKIKQNGTVPAEEDINWITSMTQELAVLHSESMVDIQNDLTPEELADPPIRISSLPLGSFPSARQPSPVPEASTAPPADEIEKSKDQGTLPPEPGDSSSSETGDIGGETEDVQDETEETSAETVQKSETLPPERQSYPGGSVPAREPSIPPPTASVGGYTPPWETSPPQSEVPGPGPSGAVDVEETRSRNQENTIPLTIDDLTAVAGDRDRDKPPPPLAQDGEVAGTVPLGWKLVTLGLCVALLISLYFNWRSYASDADRSLSDKESAVDTGQTGAPPTAGNPTDSVNGDTLANPDGKDTPPAGDVTESAGTDDPSVSQETPKKTKRKKSRSRSRSKSRRTRTTQSTNTSPSEPANGQRSTKSDPRPSGTTGVLSILVPSYARGPVSITVDKRPKGNAPLKLTLTPGLHEVVQTYKGSRSMRIVLIQKGKTKAITAKVPK
jgi:hypothetical protein